MQRLTLAEVLDLTPPDELIEGYYDCRDPDCPAWGPEPPWWRHYHPERKRS